MTTAYMIGCTDVDNPSHPPYDTSPSPHNVPVIPSLVRPKITRRREGRCEMGPSAAATAKSTG